MANNRNLTGVMDSEHFSGVWGRLKKAIEKWQQGDGPTVNGRKAFSLELQEEMEKAINQTADTDLQKKSYTVDPEAYEWALKFDGFAVAYRDFKTRAISAYDVSEVEADGDSRLWRTLHTLNVYADEKPDYSPPHMTVKEMRDQFIPEHQIAAIYGFTDENGNPDFHKLGEEAKRPGQFFDKKKWVHPALRSRMAASAREWESRLPRAAEYEDPNEVKAVTPPVPLEELLALDAPAPQIAMLHGMDEAQAYELKREYAAKQEKAGKRKQPEDTNRFAQSSDAAGQDAFANQ